MASARKKLSIFAVMTVLGATGYYAYSVFAAQGQGTLAQAPLNIQSSIRPAFIMAVDNSGSMGTDQTLFRTDDGRGFYCNALGKIGFFAADGSPYEAGECGGATTFLEGVDIVAAQQPDAYGALRAPEYNRAYYNPATVYLPWRKADGSYEPNSPINAAKEDPRGGGTTFDFTRAETFLLDLPAGSIVRQGTKYRNTDTAKKSSCGSATFVTAPSDVTLSAVLTCNLEIEYYRARVYLSDTVASPVGFDIGKRILAPGIGPLGTNLWRYDFAPGNFLSSAAYNASVQNFANYWTYSGNRNRAMIAGMTQSLGDVTNMRVGYFQINPSPPTGNVQMYDIDAPLDKGALYTKMRLLNASGGTPTRTATAYMINQFRRTGVGAPVELVCQKNAGMLFTDGFTNETSVSGGFNVGNADGALPAPFGGGISSSNSIADFAADGYFKNLRPDLAAGKVPVPSGCSATNPDPRLDCNQNLHMNFYGVTLGARGRVYEVNANSTADPYTYPPGWAATGNTSLKPENVDDIWHASLTSRGEFINAQSPAAISEAMRRILASVGAGTTPSGSIAVSGSRIGEGSLTVVPEYTSTNNGTDWYSLLTAQAVTSSALGVTYTPLWEASAKLPPATGRKIMFGKTTGPLKPSVLNFDGSSLSLDNLCADMLATCTKTGDRSITNRLAINVNEATSYLRGDTSLQIVGVTGKLRARTTRLGDIVNSSPIVSAPVDDYGYQSLAGPTAGTYDPYNYAAYLAFKKTRDPMVYVGANDGMFHAFNGRTGVESFAYIPSTAVGHMGNLLFPYNPDDKEAQVFNHRYFVDGPVTISDVYDGSTWKTIAIGTSGAGGRSIFAIDVTDPTSFNASKVLWEINDGVTGTVKSQIGNVLGKPIIVPVKSSTGLVSWKAIFGNGYGSDNKSATLFVVDVISGAATTYTAKEAASTFAENGLGNVIAIDRYLGTSTTTAGDGYVDTVYSGDQNGAVWKFDLRGTTPPTAPLFISADSAGNRQAILGGFEAAAGPGGGVMVYFGTGSFSFANDPADKQAMSLYSVLDRFSVSPTTLTRVNLQQQRVVSDNGDSRTLTNNTPLLGTSGWYLDLGVGSGSTITATGERSVGYPVLANGVIFFPTFDPSTTDSCATSGTNRLYGLSSLSGGGALSQVRVGAPNGASPGANTGSLKLDSTGSAPVKDVAVLTTPRVSPVTGTATSTEVDDALAAKCSMVVQAPGSSKLYLPRPCGRQSWRQVK